MNTTTSISDSDLIRRHAADVYVAEARRSRNKTFSINAGVVHKALMLNNLVPSVCNALGSKKFLTENRLRLVAKTGPPSGKSTSVTCTYEFLDIDAKPPNDQDAWARLRGALKEVFAELGGGEAFLQKERDHFSPRKESQ